MNVITLSVEIHEDRRIVVDLPPETPLGVAEVTIMPPSAVDQPLVNTAREIARAKLIAGGALNTAHHAPPGSVSLSNEELERIGQLRPGARSSEEIIDEERGSY